MNLFDSVIVFTSFIELMFL